MGLASIIIGAVQQSTVRPAGSSGASLEPLRYAPGLDRSMEPRDVLTSLALAPLVSGRQPYARTANLEAVKPEVPLRPARATLRRTAEGGPVSTQLCTGPGWTLLVERWTDRSATLTVTAVSDGLASSVLAEATADASASTAGPNTVPMGFWYAGPSNQGVRRPRNIEIVDWSDIRPNYASTVAAALDDVMSMDATQVSGRLLLLHGPAGTGKTTAIRALAHAWRSWCQVDDVLDPEVLFDKSAYLYSVILGSDGVEAPGRWRLLVLEDCDELIRTGAKRDTGQALARLLNLTDGLLGQGMEVLLCITTNEELSRLHPAVARPGRCLAEIEVGALPAAEAARWLGTSAGIPQHGATLAELYRLRGTLRKVEHASQPEPVGMYL